MTHSRWRQGLLLVLTLTLSWLSVCAVASSEDALYTIDKADSGYWYLTPEWGFLAPHSSPAFTRTPHLPLYEAVLRMAHVNSGHHREEFLAAAQALPPIEDCETLSEAEMEDSFNAVGYVAFNYLRALRLSQRTGTTGPLRLPANLAVPLICLSDRLGRPPSLGYASGVLDNCVWNETAAALRAADPVSLAWPWTVQRSLSGTEHEQGFYEAHCEVERTGARAFWSGVTVARLVRELSGKNASVTAEDLARVSALLYVITDSVREMLIPLRNMYRQIPFTAFYDEVRPFFMYDDSKSPRTVEYEGVPPRDSSLRTSAAGWHVAAPAGPTGAMTSSLPFLDALMSVNMTDPSLRHMLEAFRGYWPAAHRRLIESVERGPSLRNFVIEHSSRSADLVYAYDDTLASMAEWRSSHVIHTATFITQRLPPGVRDAIGTGGSVFSHYLCHHMQVTDEARLSDASPGVPIPLTCFCCCVDPAASVCQTRPERGSTSHGGGGGESMKSDGHGGGEKKKDEL